MMADDIATYPGNPHPHQIFNRPGGIDVYEGVPVVSSLVPCTHVLGISRLVSFTCILALCCSCSPYECTCFLQHRKCCNLLEQSCYAIGGTTAWLKHWQTSWLSAILHAGLQGARRDCRKLLVRAFWAGTYCHRHKWQSHQIWA